MQLDRTRLTSSESQRRLNSRVCVYCRESGYFIASCPTRPKECASQRTQECWPAQSLSALPYPICLFLAHFSGLTTHSPCRFWKTLVLTAVLLMRFSLLPWLAHHNLHSALPPSPKVSNCPVNPPELSSVPEVYHELGEAFSKQHTLSLPPHCPYDCRMDLLPGAWLPSSRLYNLSSLEWEAMESYISESLAIGLIRPSSSPVDAGFFFVKKKDG